MPGTFVFKPIEANLIHDTDLIGKMNPYCAFSVGNVRIKSQVCNKGGKHPHWNDVVTIPSTGEVSAVVDLMDKDKITKDDTIGTFTIDLQEVQNRGSLSKWYPLFYKNKPAGEILMEACFQCEGLGGQSYGTGLTGAEYGAGSAGYCEGGQYGTATSETMSSTTGIAQEKIIEEHSSAYISDSKFFTEQSQVVTPQTFMKEVDVFETVSVNKQIETTVPQKVLKSVQVTEAVPVTKEIEVCEPIVVKKLIETIEPRLVTKTIQVVEDVPVTKEVDVVEMVSHMERVETIEPQIVTRQVEVTEQVPVMQNVTATEPVCVKKLIEFEQPLTTTKTITKEIQQPIIVDEKIRTEIGAATLSHRTENFSTSTYVGQPYATGKETFINQQAGGYASGSTGLSGTDAFLKQEEGYTTGIQAPQCDTTYTNLPKKF
jgi:hypothetical protein